jgi:adenylate cyclase class 2
MTHGAREIEIKLAVSSADAARRLLRGAGFRLYRRRVLEANTVFDTPAARLRGSGCLLRVRQAGRRSTLTYKGAGQPGRFKSREELEVEISDMRAFIAILSRLGYREVFRYEKYRTEYKAADSDVGHATLDETPIGIYLELEGPPAWIDAAARRLGFTRSEYITESYGRLFLEWRKGSAHGARASRDMLFA